MSILQKVLKENLGKEIVVVMTDSRVLEGELVEFDDECIRLYDVSERHTRGEEEWGESLVRVESSSVALTKLRTITVRLDTVSCIWEWGPEILKAQSDITRQLNQAMKKRGK
ncbi:MAG: LSM domain-containing protein [Candidatus Thermoplasmatota archaeon]